MKKLVHIITLGVLLIIVLASCEKRCVYCDIYDEEGYWVKDYGEFCGDYLMTADYELDADEHASYYYGGWAEYYSY